MTPTTKDLQASPHTAKFMTFLTDTWAPKLQLLGFDGSEGDYHRIRSGSSEHIHLEPNESTLGISVVLRKEPMGEAEIPGSPQKHESGDYDVNQDWFLGGSEASRIWWTMVPNGPVTYDVILEHLDEKFQREGLDFFDRETEQP